jgi:hypothetical protein
MQQEVETIVKRSETRLRLLLRPGTTDEKVVEEVLRTGVYEKPSIGFFIAPGEKWLDLGGNIGTFALLCLLRGARVVSYEPEPENYALLRQNIALNGRQRVRTYRRAVGTEDGTMSLYVCNGEYNKYRHTLCPKRGRRTIPVRVEDIRSVVANHGADCVKMDIEGAEIEILEKWRPEGIQKLVFEYSFDVDKSIPRFLAIIRRLRECFEVVHYTKVKEDQMEYNYFPAATLVYCHRPHAL